MTQGEANGLIGRPVRQSTRQNKNGFRINREKGSKMSRAKEYAGQESWSQGEVGPRFALSRSKNLCHISQTLWWVGNVRSQAAFWVFKNRRPMAVSPPVHQQIVPVDLAIHRSNWHSAGFAQLHLRPL